jgi:hypothetical protein
VPHLVSDEIVIGYPWAREITLTYDPRAGTLQADTRKKPRPHPDEIG